LGWIFKPHRFQFSGVAAAAMRERVSAMPGFSMAAYATASESSNGEATSGFDRTGNFHI
jgi:hypothetical protein